MTKEQEQIGFLIPRGGGGDSSGEFVHVNPPKPATSEIATMLRDFLNTGEFAACQAAMDWLKERGEYEPERRVQLASLTRLLRVLVCGAIRRACQFEESSWDGVNWADVRPFSDRIATDWKQFKMKVTELFAFDLYEMDDAIRFVVDVMRPAKVSDDGNGEVA